MAGVFYGSHMKVRQKNFPALTSQTREIAKLFVKQNYPITICAPILWRSLVTLWRSPIKSMNWGCQMRALNYLTSAILRTQDPLANIQRPDRIPVACIAYGMWTVSMCTWQAAHRISRLAIPVMTKFIRSLTCETPPNRRKLEDGGTQAQGGRP